MPAPSTFVSDDAPSSFVADTDEEKAARKKDLLSQMESARTEGKMFEGLTRDITGLETAARLVPGRGAIGHTLLNTPDPYPIAPLPPLVEGQSLRDFRTELLSKAGISPADQELPIVKAPLEFGEEMASELSRPESIGLMASGAPGARVFQAEMIKNSPQAIQAEIEANKEKGPLSTEALKSDLGAILSVAGPVGIARHLDVPEKIPAPEITGRQLMRPEGAQPDDTTGGTLATIPPKELFEPPTKGETNVRVKNETPVEKVEPKVDEKTTPEPAVAAVPAKEEITQLTPAIIPGGLTEKEALTGKAHALIRDAQVAKDKALPPDQKQNLDLVLDHQEGFVDQNGRFVSRADGAKWFKEKTGKDPEKPGELHSEDLRDAGLLKHLDDKKPEVASDVPPEQSVPTVAPKPVTPVEAVKKVEPTPIPPSEPLLPTEEIEKAYRKWKQAKKDVEDAEIEEEKLRAARGDVDFNDKEKYNEAQANHSAAIDATTKAKSALAKAHETLVGLKINQEFSQYRGKTYPSGTQTITGKTLKTQKASLLDQVDAAIKDAPEEGAEKITISVPGDGEFTIENSKDALKRFREHADENFPETVSGPSGPKKASVKGKSIPKVSEPKPDDMAKVAGEFASEDKSRFAITSTYADGTQIVGTDGRQLIRIVTDRSPGKPDAPVRLTPEGKIDPKAEGKYPNWKAVGDPKAELLFGGMDTGQLIHIIRQAQVFRNTSLPDRSKHSTVGVELYVNKDRSLGAKMKAEGDEFQHNVQPDSLFMGTYNPDLLSNAIEAARRLGNDRVDVYAHSGSDGPIGFVGKNHESLVMPFRGDKGSLRDDAPKFSAVSGKSEHGKLPEGYGPLPNPLEAFTEYSDLGNTGKFQTKVEGDDITFSEVKTRKGYGREGDSTYMEDVGTVKLDALPDGKESRRKVIEPIVNKYLGDKNSNIKGLTNALLNDVDAALKQRRAAEREVEERRKSASGIDTGALGTSGMGGAKPGGKGIAGSVRNKWTSATEGPLGSEAGFINLEPIRELWEKAAPAVRASIEAVKNAVKENVTLPKTSDYRRAVLNWSAKLQRSFGEAGEAQKEILSKVKDPIRRDGITNWMQSAGDATVLKDRLAKTLAWRDPVTGEAHPQAKRLAEGYEAALNLTPEEISIATDARNAYDTLATRGMAHDVLNSFKDNYVTQIWNLKQGPTGGGGSRTLKEKFRFSKASTFPTFFDGEQAGFVPKTKDISKLLPVYLHEMNSVIAARQLVSEMSKGKASDGRPLLAAKGRGMTLDDPKGKTTLILPDALGKDSRDYKSIDNQPALHGWRWQTVDSAGNPVFMKADLALHPEAYSRFKNVLGRSAIKEWYDSPGSFSSAIPKALIKGLDFAQSETKRTMLGVLTPFHQVQEATHAVGHKVNPFFNNPKIDIVNDKAQMDAAKHGLMLLPDRTSADQFMEGFKQSKIVSAIPGLGPLADHYSNYLFHQYIPGIKFKTYQAILDRNMKRFTDDIASNKVSTEDVKILSAEQANAAYGHLNYADLARNPTILHIMRIGLLAPDFLEARFRFSGQAVKGITGNKIGREQVVALATLAVAQATLAWTSAQLSGGQWDPKDPFSFHVGNKKFTMRSVPEDSLRLMNDTRAFVYARLNPVIGKGAVQLLSGTDWRGQKVKAGQTLKEIAEQPVPLALRPLFGLGNSPLSGWEQLLGAAGLKVSRYSAQSEIRKRAHEWMSKSSDPKIRATQERYEKETLPDSDYKGLREALINKDFKSAKDQYQKLLETRKSSTIQQTMEQSRPFTGSSTFESKFVASLSPDDKSLYEQAKKERESLKQRFREMKSRP